MQFDGLVQGRLLRRYKRFLADVEMPGGDVITTHCPNTGAMTGCAEPGSRVWLSRSAVSTRKYPYTWELTQTAQGLACIHSARANQVVREAFAAAMIPGFEGYPQISAEVKYGRSSRADLVLQGPGPLPLGRFGGDGTGLQSGVEGHHGGVWTSGNAVRPREGEGGQEHEKGRGLRHAGIVARWPPVRADNAAPRRRR